MPLMFLCVCVFVCGHPWCTCACVYECVLCAGGQSIQAPEVVYEIPWDSSTYVTVYSVAKRMYISIIVTV